ncbi:hypothetical protein CEXT_11651 [Caerostris extrusa]|uniref:Uncharacterized protein n=1 Tax=Caerostris extrusa TaxID=172846 RepID=A0AAV4XAD1_CAEEX|nr:hypothetical protein CEXT_11651 [Caerostris extrusa]
METTSLCYSNRTLLEIWILCNDLEMQVGLRQRDSLMAGESLCGEECLREILAGIVQRCSELPVKKTLRMTSLRIYGRAM